MSVLGPFNNITVENLNLPFFKLLQITPISLQKFDYWDVVDKLLNILIMLCIKTDTLVLT